MPPLSCRACFGPNQTGHGKGSYKDLTPECQRRFREINLHWHDLRHEYASRLVERGVPLAQVRDLLGHASILTTERYDNQRLEALQAAVARLEEGKTFDVVRLKPDSTYEEATDKVSRIFQVPAEQGFTEGLRLGSVGSGTGNRTPI